MEARHDAAGAGAVPFLPHEVVAALLAHMGLRERLRVCALVCRAWRAAAAAATTSINLSSTTAGSVAAWLASDGPQLTALKLLGHHDYARPQLQLAWGQLAGLRRLSVSQCGLGASSGGPDSLRCLTSLRLEWCVLAWSGGLAALSALTGLRQLELSGLTAPAGSTEAQMASSLTSALGPLRQLTRLELSGQGLAADAALAPSLSRLTRLRELECASDSLTAFSFAAALPESFMRLRELECASDSLTAASFAAALPASLTRLLLGASALQLSASSSPGLAQLSGLQRLQLVRHGGFEPALLTGWPVLQHLCLRCGLWLPAGAQPGAGASALLAALAALPALEHLQLSGSLAGAPAAACSALVASSALTCLDLQVYQLPVGCSASLFSRPLPRLRRLLLGHGSDCGVTLTASDVAPLATCCRKLEQLQLQCEEPGQALAPLTGLARLTHLDVRGPCVDDWAVQHVLVQLSGLRRLSLSAAPELTWLGVRCLTALQQLQLLTVFDAPAVGTYGVRCEAAEGLTPVWQQLQECCGNSRPCQLALAQQQADALARQLEEAQTQAGELQQAASEAWDAVLQLQQLLLTRGGLEPQQAQQQARAERLQQRAAQAQARLSALLEQAEQLAAQVDELLQREEWEEEGSPSPDNHSDSESDVQAAVLQAHATSLQQLARQLQERVGSAAAQLGVLRQQLQLTQQQQTQRLAEQQAQGRRISELEAQVADLRAQLAVRRA